MRLPNSREERERLFRNLIRQCDLTSRSDRRARAERQRSAYITGTDTGARALDNKLREWVQTASSNLYAGDNVWWNASLGRKYGQEYVNKQEAAADDHTQFWIDSGASRTFALGVRFALVYDSVIFKVIANGNDPQLWLLPDPGDFGVLEERQPNLDMQEAMCHWYNVNLPTFERLIFPLPKDKKATLRAAAVEHAAPARSSSDVLPPAVSNIILSGASPTMIQGAVTGLPTVNTTMAQDREPTDELAELWVRDDDEKCWQKVIWFVAADTMLYEVSTKSDYGNADCFHLLTLDELPGYLWGMSPMDFMIGLQMWREKRLGQIDLYEDIRMDPPMLFSGVQSLTDEVMLRMRRPGGNVSTNLPGAEVKPIVPPAVADAWQYVDKIDQFFNRQGAITNASAGEGQPNVRSGDQEMALAGLSAGRARQLIMGIEACASDIGTQMFHMRQRTDDGHLIDDEGGEFILADMPEDTVMRISSHSASPYYAERIKTEAILLHKAGVLDDDELVNYSDLPRREILRIKARKRMQAKAKMGEQKEQLQARLIGAKEATAKASVLRATKS